MTTYDDLPYESLPYPSATADRLAVNATLFGLQPAPVGGATVLEVGCASGGHLIPQAMRNPGGKFVGIDASAVQIEAARQRSQALGLTNIDLQVRDLSDKLEREDHFDYILCHGVFSWVSDEHQHQILALIRDRLAPNGVAYVSYNTLPGWYQRLPLRDLMVFHGARFDGPQTQIEQAKAISRFVIGAVPDTEETYRAILRHFFEPLAAGSGSYLFHEYLSEHNRAHYFHQFVDLASASGLRYLADSDLPTMMTGDLSDSARETLETVATDLIATEQYLDFLRNRSFRRSLLIPAECEPENNLAWRHPSPLMVRANAETAGAIEKIEAPDVLPIRAALSHLARRSPAAISIEELARAAGVPAPMMGEAILGAYATASVDLTTVADTFVPVVSTRPVACPLARLQIRQGEDPTTRLHTTAELGPLAGRLLALMDGEHTLDDASGRLFDGQEVTSAIDGYTDLDPVERRRQVRIRLDALSKECAAAGLLIS